MGKGLVGTLVGALVSALVLLAAMGATFPTKGEVSRRIEKESPYVADRNLILHRLGEIERKVDKLLDAAK
jgi:hypothetical protein